jgi:hypothetical protein
MGLSSEIVKGRLDGSGGGVLGNLEVRVVVAFSHGGG